MGRGKHASDSAVDLSEIPFKQIIIVIVIIAILFGLGFGGFILVKKITSDKPEENKPEKIEEVSEMIKTLDGYDVIGQIKINDLNIDTYIVNSFEENALKVAAGKLHGKKLNEVGNFSIVGHNYDNIFAKLLEIEKGEEIIVIDPEMKETKYEVVDVYPVEPEDLTPLLDIKDKTRITLITCESAAQTRLVVVADKK